MINRDDEHEQGISTFAKHRAPLHRHATPVRTERDLADTVDGNRASARRCDHKAISRTNNFYEVYPAAAAGGYAWNVALLLRKMAAGDARTYRPPTARAHAAFSRFGSPRSGDRQVGLFGLRWSSFAP